MNTYCAYKTGKKNADYLEEEYSTVDRRGILIFYVALAKDVGATADAATR